MGRYITAALLAAAISAVTIPAHANSIAYVEATADDYHFETFFIFTMGSGSFVGNMLSASYAEGDNTGWVERLAYELTGPNGEFIAGDTIFSPIADQSELNWDSSRSDSIVIDSSLAEGTTYKISFEGDTSGRGYAGNGTAYLTFSVDGANLVPESVSSVPEPETWAMLLTGLAAIGGMARRRDARLA